MTLRYAKPVLATIGVTLSFVSAASAQGVPGPKPDGPYVVSEGYVSGSPVALMVDETTGATWVLGSKTTDGQLWTFVPTIRSADVLSTGWIPLTLLAAGK